MNRHGGRRWVPLLGLVVLLHCGEDPFSAAEERELAEARARWNTAALQDYQVEVRLGCFCQAAFPVFTRLTMQGGQVVAAEPLETVPNFDDVPLDAWPTVPQMFELVESAAHESIYDRIEVRFEPGFGYPQRVELHCKPNTLDCGAVYELQNLVAPP